MATDETRKRAFGAVASLCVLLVFGEGVFGYDLPRATVWLLLLVGASSLVASAYYLGRRQ